MEKKDREGLKKNILKNIPKEGISPFGLARVSYNSFKPVSGENIGEKKGIPKIYYTIINEMEIEGKIKIKEEKDRGYTVYKK